MDTIEHLLVCLAEECGEVAKECHKSLRFGLEDKVTIDPAGPRGTDGPTNREKIIGELNDLLGVVQMLVDRCVLPDRWQDHKAQEAKALKVARYMDYAVRVGAMRS
jgi:hypothetical protein